MHAVTLSKMFDRILDQWILFLVLSVTLTAEVAKIVAQENVCPFVPGRFSQIMRNISRPMMVEGPPPSLELPASRRVNAVGSASEPAVAVILLTIELLGDNGDIHEPVVSLSMK